MTKSKLITVKKPEIGKLGITVRSDNGKLTVKNIAPNGLFANTGLQTGMVILGINDVSTDSMISIQAVAIMKEAESTLEIRAVEQTKSKTRTFLFIAEKPSKDSKLGVKVSSYDGKLTVKSITPDGVLDKAGLETGMVILGINDVSTDAMISKKAVAIMKEAESTVTIQCAEQVKPKTKSSRPPPPGCEEGGVW